MQIFSQSKDVINSLQYLFSNSHCIFGIRSPFCWFSFSMVFSFQILLTVKIIFWFWNLPFKHMEKLNFLLIYSTSIPMQNDKKSNKMPSLISCDSVLIRSYESWWKSQVEASLFIAATRFSVTLASKKMTETTNPSHVRLTHQLLIMRGSL